MGWGIKLNKHYISIILPDKIKTYKKNQLGTLKKF